MQAVKRREVGAPPAARRRGGEQDDQSTSQAKTTWSSAEGNQIEPGDKVGGSKSLTSMTSPSM
jgi:hypothetical protein